MYFRVQHTTRYNYSGEVSLGPHLVRLRPRMTAQTHLVKYDLQFHPAPVSHVETLDAEGNQVDLAWFSQPTRSLVIVSSFEARAREINPYDYVVNEPRALNLPVEYKRHASVLAPYRTQSIWDGPVVELADKVRKLSGPTTQGFLNELLKHFRAYKTVVREQGEPMHPNDLIASRCGACRDLAVLFVELCRQVGLAARFVSGYWRGVIASEKRYLHAWAEIYLPGAGWRGYDPSSGLAVTGGHIPVCASRDPQGAAPVEGTVVGDNIAAEMSWSIKISVKPS